MKYVALSINKKVADGFSLKKTAVAWYGYPTGAIRTKPCRAAQVSQTCICPYLSSYFNMPILGKLSRPAAKGSRLGTPIPSIQNFKC